MSKTKGTEKPQPPAADPDEVFKKYVFIRSKNEAYLGYLEIDAFAREFHCTVYVWYTNKEGKLSFGRSSPHLHSPSNVAQIENFDSVVHLYYYLTGHFTLLALQVPTQPTQERASSFGRKRARLYV